MTTESKYTFNQFSVGDKIWCRIAYHDLSEDIGTKNESNRDYWNFQWSSDDALQFEIIYKDSISETLYVHVPYPKMFAAHKYILQETNARDIDRKWIGKQIKEIGLKCIKSLVKPKNCKWCNL